MGITKINLKLFSWLLIFLSLAMLNSASKPTSAAGFLQFQGENHVRSSSHGQNQEQKILDQNPTIDDPNKIIFESKKSGGGAHRGSGGGSNVIHRPPGNKKNGASPKFRPLYSIFSATLLAYVVSGLPLFCF